MFEKYNPFIQLEIFIIKLFSNKIYNCPNCGYQFKEKICYCPNCYVSLRWTKGD